MKFSYRRYGNTVRPVIPIKIGTKDRLIKHEALVDSGADLCIFDVEIATTLGIDVRKGRSQEIFGVGGKASMLHICPVLIEVGGWQYQIEAGFMSGATGHLLQYGILGQRGFFEFFVVKFDLSSEEIELKKK